MSNFNGGGGGVNIVCVWDQLYNMKIRAYKINGIRIWHKFLTCICWYYVFNNRSKLNNERILKQAKSTLSFKH